MIRGLSLKFLFVFEAKLKLWWFIINCSDLMEPLIQLISKNVATNQSYLWEYELLFIIQVYLFGF